MKAMDTLQPGIPSPTPHLFLKIGTLLLLIYKIAFLIYLYILWTRRDSLSLSLILIILGLIKDFNILCYLKVCLTILLFVKNFVAKALLQCDSNSLMHISLIIYCNYKKEKWYFWHWMAMIFFRLQRKLIKIKIFFEIAKPILLTHAVRKRLSC